MRSRIFSFPSAICGLKTVKCSNIFDFATAPSHIYCRGHQQTDCHRCIILAIRWKAEGRTFQLTITKERSLRLYFKGGICLRFGILYFSGPGILHLSKRAQNFSLEQEDLVLKGRMDSPPVPILRIPLFRCKAFSKAIFGSL
ncbi:hypothetical protein AVEN_93429-1 [Araneus ventricosus]|uniref:Uncharacterized protein n=1 Tax=Araneus ventricosus TaxID=182803 RepID=A0A4Y2AQW2_ARAVE|nr:hypothetical protein AVEN_93429-1 [Araneus ventricosus]